jgi:acyl-CoA thioesterase-2
VRCGAVCCPTVDAQEFLGLETTADPLRYRLPVTQSICTWGGFLFGGSGLGAAITAMELATGRPIVWATAQYLSFAQPPSVMDIDVLVPSSGHWTSQARAVGHVGDTEILTVNGALGSRPDETSGTWAGLPDDLPSPDECEPLDHIHREGESVASQFDRRMIKGRRPDEFDGTPGDGNTRLWVRLPEGLDMSGAALAVLGDYVPLGIRHALGVGAGGNSLDNTLRVARLVPTEWVFSDIYVHAVANGFAHGRVHLWAEDGTLLAIASQSTIIRYWKN